MSWIRIVWKPTSFFQRMFLDLSSSLSKRLSWISKKGGLAPFLQFFELFIVWPCERKSLWLSFKLPKLAGNGFFPYLLFLQSNFVDEFAFRYNESLCSREIKLFRGGVVIGQTASLFLFFSSVRSFVAMSFSFNKTNGNIFFSSKWVRCPTLFVFSVVVALMSALNFPQSCC